MGITGMASMDGRFFYRLGSSQLERTVCSVAGKVGYEYTIGGNRGTDPETTTRAR